MSKTKILTTSSKRLLWNRIPRWLKVLTPMTAVLAIIAYLVIGWIIADRLTAVNPQKVEYDQTITGISGAHYTIRGSAYNVNGVIGGIRNDGSHIGIFNPPSMLDNANSVSARTLDSLSGPALTNGQKISLQGNIWTSDPLRALNTPFQDITYPSRLGAMKAWLIPAGNDTPRAVRHWVIGVHGIGADKNELLRFVRPVTASGANMMIINYRNDTNNPQSSDSRNHLSDSEWQDLEAAVQYAKANGATDVSLYGISLGGSIVSNYLARSTEAASTNIDRVILDSPALDWKQTIEAQITRSGFPQQFYYPAKTILKLKYGIDTRTISTIPAEIRHRTLIIHNADDRTVPQTASQQLAAARPDLVTLVDLGGGGHARSWNYDQQQYEKLVTDFLKP